MIKNYKNTIHKYITVFWNFSTGSMTPKRTICFVSIPHLTWIGTPKQIIAIMQALLVNNTIEPSQAQVYFLAKLLEVKYYFHLIDTTKHFSFNLSFFFLRWLVPLICFLLRSYFTYCIDDLKLFASKHPDLMRLLTVTQTFSRNIKINK